MEMVEEAVLLLLLMTMVRVMGFNWNDQDSKRRGVEWAEGRPAKKGEWEGAEHECFERVSGGADACRASRSDPWTEKRPTETRRATKTLRTCVMLCAPHDANGTVQGEPGPVVDVGGRRRPAAKGW